MYSKSIAHAQWKCQYHIVFIPRWPLHPGVGAAIGFFGMILICVCTDCRDDLKWLYGE